AGSGCSVFDTVDPGPGLPTGQTHLCGGHDCAAWRGKARCSGDLGDRSSGGRGILPVSATWRCGWKPKATCSSRIRFEFYLERAGSSFDQLATTKALSSCVAWARTGSVLRSWKASRSKSSETTMEPKSG